MLLQDAIWLADTFYFPAPQLQPDFERISYTSHFKPTVRERAAELLAQADIRGLHVLAIARLDRAERAELPLLVPEHTRSTEVTEAEGAIELDVDEAG